MERAPTPQPDPDDDALVVDLRRVLGAVDPIPEHVRLAARVAIEWTTLEAELAELVHDSSVDEPVLAVRGETGPRALTFETPELTIEIEAEPQADAPGGLMSLVGQLIPAQAAQISIHHEDGIVSTRSDARGRFAAAGMAPGALHLRCRLADARLVQTAPLTI